MTRILNYSVPEEYNNTNILGFLKSRGYSHTIITLLKKTKDGICLNGSWAWVKDVLKTGDTLTITIPEIDHSAKIQPVFFPLDVIYEDEDLLIVNKPAGMPVHPSQGHYENSLANAVAYYFGERGAPFTYRCINRLDKNTSGLLIIAANILSASALSAMMKQRLIRREYLALCEGLTPASGTVTAPIGRTDNSTIERCVSETEGAYACTHYRRLSVHDGYSLVSLSLETGRTHQIRVHMKHIGHPLPGDFLYNPDYTKISRQALHSYRLTFTHPITGKPLDFKVPLPQDMTQLLTHESSFRR